MMQNKYSNYYWITVRIQLGDPELARFIAEVVVHSKVLTIIKVNFRDTWSAHPLWNRRIWIDEMSFPIAIKGILLRMILWSSA